MRGLLVFLLWACAGFARADEVLMLFGKQLPPYVIEDSAESQGLEPEIARAALALRGHRLKVLFVPRSALPALLRAGPADGAQRGSPDLLEADGFFHAAAPTVMYRDVAISLRRNQLGIWSTDDLRGKSVLAFDGAREFLGAEFKAAVARNPRYAETPDEAAKVAALFSGRVQVYVGDLNVFRYYRARSRDAAEEVTLHRIFLPSTLVTNNAVFRRRALRDDFEAGLRQLQASGQYDQIVARHLGEARP
ncbi:MAG TPA: transporter substrate-binding domain-containing protein [Telluria sp.]|nr:transporter substrate-binding domain-containing protein [Telluria sp.]